jgi:hypothetical protein
MKRILATLVTVGLALGLVVSVPQPRTAAAYTPPRLKVAVLESTISENWAKANNEGTGLARQQAIAAYLRSKGWDVTEVGDGLLETVQTAQQYDVIILGHVFGLNTQPSKVLQTYVRDGGGLVALWGSPRVAPEYGNTWTAHWAGYLNGEAAEWGPLSEVYQVNFINDQAYNGWPRADYYAKWWPGASHPILSGASQILKERNQPSGDYTYDSAFQTTNRQGGFELVNMLRGNRTATPILTFQFRSPEVLKYYPAGKNPGVYPAAEAVRYGSGRSVYFHFAPDDALLYTAIGAHTNPSGVPDKEAAGALLESAIQWAGTDDGKTGAIYRGGKTTASLKVYGDGIYANQYVENDGNVASMGKAVYRVYDPSGRCVVAKQLHVQNYVSNQPGQVRQYAWSYRPGGQLKSGKYRVEVEFVGNFPWMNMHHVERVYVTRSQGVNIPTVPVATKAAGLGTVAVDPDPLTPNGDGWNDLAYVNYTTDQPARVAVKLLDMWRRPIATAMSATNFTAGPHSARIPTTRSDGKALADGQYYVVVEASNSAGWSSKSALLFVSRFGKATALGTTPAIASVATTPSLHAQRGRPRQHDRDHRHVDRRRLRRREGAQLERRGSDDREQRAHHEQQDVHLGRQGLGGAACCGRQLPLLRGRARWRDEPPVAVHEDAGAEAVDATSSTARP